MKKWFLCQCSGEVICVEKYEGEGLPTKFWFSLYRHGNYKPSLLNRIKWAWRVLLNGEIHTDQVTFDVRTTEELRDFLNNELPNRL